MSPRIQAAQLRHQQIHHRFFQAVFRQVAGTVGPPSRWQTPTSDTCAGDDICRADRVLGFVNLLVSANARPLDTLSLSLDSCQTHGGSKCNCILRCVFFGFCRFCHESQLTLEHSQMSKEMQRFVGWGCSCKLLQKLFVART